ncbi:uncharacterized protein LOC116845665 [Odontomachus brunneus]|uniref:uncharacterized protein LOC116845665 n=1 Tax=Odontomachus brunneus TaxID=486640 RepID=UPI0013F25A80|nr:uncharacterized protein LOC116845665 [Odontomachus brunneus]
MKSPAYNEEEKWSHQVYVCNESNNISKKEILDRHQESRAVNIARVVRGNSTNLFLESFEKSSEADIDFEELEADLPMLTNESPIIISADDVPRSASMKSFPLKCECHSRGDHKYTSAIRKGRYTETDYSSSSEMESTGRKSMGDSEFTDMSSEDTDLLSDYAVSYNRAKTNGRNKEASRHTCRVMKSSLLTNNSARMRTSFSFFNVFFDIVFWPFILLRTKQ